MAADVTLTSAKMPAEETSQMPPAADQPHDDRVSAGHPETPSPTPSADAAPGGDHSGSNPAEQGESGSGEGASAEAGSGEAGSGGGSLGSEPHRRRRRRRRRPPREFITPQPSGAAGALSHDAAADEAGPSTDRSGEYAASGGAANSDDETGVRGDAAMAPGTAAPGAVPREGMPGDRPHRRRRRRRRPPPGAIGATPAPGALGSALPPVDASAGADSDSGVAGAEGSAAGEGDGAPGGSQRPRVYLRRPVRGRRQLSRPPGLQAGLVASLPVAGETQPGDAASGGDASAPRAEGEFRRPRRDRRPLPRTGEAAPAGEGQSLGGTPWDTERQPRRGGMRGPRPGGDRAYNRQTQRPGEPPGPSGPGREIGTGVAGQRSRDRDERGGRGRGPGGRDGQRGRGRDAGPRRIEQKLYTLESMVDRGFEDVPDEAEDSGSRRVHWMIVKRTVADQKSGKPMSASYVLQREGGETEFPNLGAARTAANKTIVHPEKLTMSKAEHAAAKNTK